MRRSVSINLQEPFLDHPLPEWCPGAESNHRHADFQSAALPTELPGPKAISVLIEPGGAFKTGKMALKLSTRPWPGAHLEKTVMGGAVIGKFGGSVQLNP
jgi:hypothetical protein